MMILEQCLVEKRETQEYTEQKIIGVDRRLLFYYYFLSEMDFLQWIGENIKERKGDGGKREEWKGEKRKGIYCNALKGR